MLYKVKINDTIIRLDLDVAGEGEGSEVLDVGAVSLSEGWDAEIQRWTRDFVLPDESRESDVPGRIQQQKLRHFEGAAGYSRGWDLGA